ncbi:MAG: OsmC family peroxiredoxin, partial [Thaumarchaeota archaeon]|nr:OsmC family peroxiredoxin [Nitrososphaerota archaeon]
MNIMTKINNVDLDKVANTIAKGKEDISTLRKPVKMQGEWNLDPNSEFQFKTELAFEKGKQVVE